MTFKRANPFAVTAAVLSTALATTFGTVSDADADQSQWMQPKDTVAFVSNIRRQVTRVECKSSGRKGELNDQSLVRFTWDPNNSGRKRDFNINFSDKFHLAFGGKKPFSKQTHQTESGRRVTCGLF